MTIEYQRGTSTLHQLDPRTKLLIAFTFTFIALSIQDPILSAVIFFSLRGLGTTAVDPKIVNQNLRQVVPVFLMFGLFNIIFRPDPNGVFLFYLVPHFNLAPIILESLIAGTGLFFRFIMIVLAVHLLLYTTPPTDMVLGLTKQGKNSTAQTVWVTVLLAVLFFIGLNLTVSDTITDLPLTTPVQQTVVALAALVIGAVTYNLASRGIPPEIAMGLSIGFATLGLLTQQAKQITDAQQARGYDVRPKNIVARIRVIVALILPIFFATIQRAQNIAVAIQARAFDYNVKLRTYRRALIFKRMDYLSMGIMVSLLLGGLTLSHFGLNQPTEQLVKAIFGL
ncbi:MAG: energy-coupling factor transporter transmembrane protein EcfT [Anaerolineales bacterium]|nr:MAG: energy-coupling factor transporter transmembrane protein EcfT [Anaerolineales bacterium]